MYVKGFEPSAFWSVARRSIQLSYAHIFLVQDFVSLTTKIILPSFPRIVNTFFQKLESYHKKC